MSILASLASLPGHAQAADVIVMIPGGLKSTDEALSPGFEQKTGSKLIMVPGPSEGVTHDAIPNRLARGEPDDVLVMVGTALDELVKQGQTVNAVKLIRLVTDLLASSRTGNRFQAAD